MKVIFTLAIVFTIIFSAELHSQTILFSKSHTIDSVDWLYFKDFQNVNGGSILFADFENKSKSAKYENKYQFGAFRFDLEGELKQTKLISDITHNFISTIVSLGSEYLCLTNQPYQYGLLNGYSKFKIGSFRMDNLLNINEIKRYPDTTYLPQMFFSPSFDFRKYFYGNNKNIFGYYTGYKTNILHEIITDWTTGQVQENKVFDLNSVKNNIVKGYIPDRFLNDVFWMETGAIEYNGEILLLGYFVSFKSDAEYSAKPLNLICKINNKRTELTYKILDYSTTAFNFFKKDEEGNFYTFRGADEIIKFNINMDIIYQKRLVSENSNFYIYYVYNFQNALFWVGSAQKSGGMKPLIIKSDYNGEKIWEICLEGNITYGTPPILLQKTPELYLIFSGQGNSAYISEIRDEKVSVKDNQFNKSLLSLTQSNNMIRIMGSKEGESYEIYSLFGQKVDSGCYSDYIDITNLSTGIYFITLSNQKFMKFIKANH